MRNIFNTPWGQHLPSAFVLLAGIYISLMAVTQNMKSFIQVEFQRNRAEIRESAELQNQVIKNLVQK